MDQEDRNYKEYRVIIKAKFQQYKRKEEQNLSKLISN
jgi:hypothetical protein